jgi:hypothetical protein
MKTRYFIVALAVLFSPQLAQAQAVPDNSQASRVDPGYRRSPTLRFDPFRNVMIRHWGFSLSSGGLVANNTLDLNDIGAIVFLADKDSLGFGEAIDISGLIPRGSGLNGVAEAMARAHIGGPLGGMFALGFSAGVSGFGSFDVDDRAVALFRDGNATQEGFTLGETRGSALAVAEYGVHATLRLGGGARDAARVTLGFGGRILKPLYYASGASVLPDGGSVLISNATSTVPNIAAQLQFEGFNTPEIVGGSVSDYLNQGSGFAADVLARIEWPSSGFAAEVMVANIGNVDIDLVERRRTNIDVTGGTFNDVYDILQGDSVDALGNTVFDSQGDPFKVDTLGFDIQDSVALSIDLPRVVRVTASAWANSILQIDVSATAPVTGEFETPLGVDVGTTWRFLRTIPFRFGVMMGGDQGIGFTGGLAIEGRNFLLQFSGGCLGGLFSKAMGGGGRFEFGFFF